MRARKEDDPSGGLPSKSKLSEDVVKTNHMELDNDALKSR
jgi:hypothetical protein